MGSLVDLKADGGVLHTSFGWFITLLEWAAALIDIFAIALLLLGAARFAYCIVEAEFMRRGKERVQRINHERISLGRYILAGLELFIVSDVIHTALSLALADLIFLLLLVIIRSITSYFLERELVQLKKDLEA